MRPHLSEPLLVHVFSLFLLAAMAGLALLIVAVLLWPRLAELYAGLGG